MSQSRRLLLTLCLGVAVSALAAPAAVSAPPPQPGQQQEQRHGTIGSGGPEALAGRYVVALDGQPALGAAASATVRAEAQALTGEHGGTVGRVYSAALRGFALRASQAEAARIAAAPGVASVSEDALAHAADEQPNPPSWGLDRIDGTQDNTYTYANSGEGVTAYVIDSGVDLDHPDFEDRARSGYDFSDNDSDASDCQGHGTHVAGTVAGKQYGVAKKADVVSVRVLNCQGTAPWSTVISGIDWVARNAAEPAVVNISISGGTNTETNQALQNLVRNTGIPVAVAAGNENRDACQNSPAAAPEALTVGSVDSSLRRASNSNYGTCLDLFSTGVGITSAANGGGSRQDSGTSMASPHVAGAAAQYLAANPSATSQQIRDAMVQAAADGTVTNPGSGSPNRLLDTADLIPTDPPGNPVADFTSQCPADSSTCTFDGTASTDPDGTVASYAWDFGDGRKGTGERPTHTYASAGTYQVKLTVTDNDGKTGSVTKNVTAGGPPPTADLVNGGFENGTEGWHEDATIVTTSTRARPHTGRGYAWMMGYGRTATENLEQRDITVPAGGATLSLWLHVTTAERGTTVYDTLAVKVDGTTVATYSNTNATSDYVRKTVDLSAYQGRSVTLSFTGKEDANLATTFLLDDIAFG
ncbi:S8 family serine peptidase [Streptomyces sp. NPDC004134]|uniref:S8 family serine peptidase n=1 Tax=Streptomyces sp. NPDC004134 TaxID=3364691 RepID=UPI0036B55B7D